MIREIEVKPIRYEEFWTVRVIRENKNGAYECVNERRFSTQPTEQEIVDILMNNASDCFVSVLHNYKLLTST